MILHHLAVDVVVSVRMMVKSTLRTIRGCYCYDLPTVSWPFALLSSFFSTVSTIAVLVRAASRRRSQFIETAVWSHCRSVVNDEHTDCV